MAGVIDFISALWYYEYMNKMEDWYYGTRTEEVCE